MATIRMALSASAERNCAANTAIMPSDNSGVSNVFIWLIAGAPRTYVLSLLARLDQRPLHQQRMQPAAIRAQHGELPFADQDAFAAFGHLAGSFEYQPADGVIILVAEVGTQGFVEVGDLGVGLDAPVFRIGADD